MSSGGSYMNSTPMSYPNAATRSQSSSTNIAMAQAPVIMPTVQTSLRMPHVQNFPSSYSVNQYPVTNNTYATEVNNSDMFMPTSVFVQRPNLSESAKNIQSPYTFSNIQPVSCLKLSKHKTIKPLPILPIQRTSTPMPSYKHLDPMLLQNYSQSYVPQLNSNAVTGTETDLNHQPTKELPQMVRSNLVSAATQEIDYNLLAETNVGEQSRVTPNQVEYRTMPEIFGQEQQESWLQQEQQHIQEQEQKQYEKYQLLKPKKPLNTELLQNDLEQGDVPVFPSPHFQENVSPSIQTTYTVADVQYQEGKQVMMPLKLFMRVCVMHSA